MKQESPCFSRGECQKIIEEVTEYGETVIITGKNKNAVLLPEDDYRSMVATIELNNIPGLADSIIDGKDTPLENCIEYNEEK